MIDESDSTYEDDRKDDKERMICRNRPNCRNWVRQSRFLQRTLLCWTVCRSTLQNCELIDAHSTLPKSASWRVWLCCLVEFWGWNAPASLWTGYFDWLTLNEDNIFAGAPVLCTFVLWTKFYSTQQHPLPPTSIHHLQIQTPRFSPHRSPFPPRQHHACLNRHIFWFGRAFWATTCWYWYPRRKIKCCGNPVKQSSLLAVLVVGTMHFLFFSSLTTTFECHSQFWQKRQQCLLFSVLLLVWYCHRPFCTLFSSIDLSVWKLSTFPNICFCNCKSNFFDDCQTAVVPYFSAVGCQLLSRRHLPSPCHLQTSCMSTSSVLIPGLVTPNNQQISLLLFLHQSLWVPDKHLYHMWVWTLYYVENC